jgi:membrane-associated phospholipid phosphatase
MYAVGRLGHTHLADAGLHGAEAVLVSATATGLLKIMAGRARPYVSADTNAHDFAFGRGTRGHDYESFPSGHASATFAFASALTVESARWWSHATWWIAPLAYGGAALVGASRVYDNEHWASDVIAGAAIGTLSGLVVARFNRSHPKNRIDRWLLPTPRNEQSALIVPTTHGVTFLWTHPL